ncbi:hypothetical protein [Xylophilus sp. ASV27]|uniref:hypothetical protein n=1 Tax=Xylophilus sp. ASV27 TaxID=2795129 RepID=UPI0018EE0D2F|nr:hypothetical protein [Xylophilus sp. ASV27]
MSIFQRFYFQREKKVAADLVDHFVKSLPPKIMSERIHTLSANRITRVLEQAFGKLAKDTATGRGFVGRSVLANNFRWGLKDAGYPKAFIDIAVEGLIVEASRRRFTPH